MTILPNRRTTPLSGPGVSAMLDAVCRTVGRKALALAGIAGMIVAALGRRVEGVEA